MINHDLRTSVVILNDSEGSLKGFFGPRPQNDANCVSRINLKI